MDTNKYTEAVRLLNHCQGVEDNVELHRRLDSFFAHLCDNFPVPDTTDPAQIDALAAVLRVPVSDLEVAVREIPPDVEDVVYPVALMRVALAVYRIPLQPTISKTFDQFHTTYHKFIEYASDRNRPRYALSRTFEEAQDEIAASTGRTNSFKENS
jgi:hypothetical protein